MSDASIAGVWVGFLVACIVLVLVKGQPVETCYAYVKDGNGNTHVLEGWRSNG